MEQFLDYAAVLALTRLSVDGLRRRMRLGQFPVPTHRSGTKKYWLKSEVERALARASLPIPITTPAQSA